MKKIVVFGATGNIGMYFIDYCRQHLNSKEYQVIAVGRKNTTYFATHGIEYVQVDLTRDSDFTKLPVDDVYAIVNMAGLLPAYMKENNLIAYVDTNISGSVRIMEYARKVKADRVLFMQTWAELAGYWGKEEVLRPEMTRKLCYTGDHAFYAITKSCVVEIMEYYHQEYGIKNFVFRLPNIYLYNPEKYYYVDGVKKVIAYRYLIDRAIKGEPIEMWGNPDAFKDIVYVKDFCQMIYKGMFADVDGGTYNVGTGIKTSFRDQIQGIVDVFCDPENVSEIIEKPDKPSFTSFVMDIRKAEEELGYKPEYDYKAYLQDYKKEMMENRFEELWGKHE